MIATYPSVEVTKKNDSFFFRDGATSFVDIGVRVGGLSLPSIHSFSLTQSLCILVLNLSLVFNIHFLCGEAHILTLQLLVGFDKDWRFAVRICWKLCGPWANVDQELDQELRCIASIRLVGQEDICSSSLQIVQIRYLHISRAICAQYLQSVHDLGLGVHNELMVLCGSHQTFVKENEGA